MRPTLGKLKQLRAELAASQKEARGQVAELRGIARALRSGRVPEPAGIDELAAGLASEARQARQRTDDAWLQSLGVTISTHDTRRLSDRG